MHYYSCGTRQLLLRRHLNVADKNRTFPTEVNRSFIYLGQILFHCNLGFTNVEYSPKCTRNPSINFLRKQVTLGRVVLKIWGRVVCGPGSLLLLQNTTLSYNRPRIMREVRDTSDWDTRWIYTEQNAGITGWTAIVDTYNQILNVLDVTILFLYTYMNSSLQIGCTNFYHFICYMNYKRLYFSCSTKELVTIKTYLLIFWWPWKIMK